MGIRLSVPYNGKKEDIPLSLTPEAANAITAPAGMLSIWTGFNPAGTGSPGKGTIINSFTTLWERLREAGCPYNAQVTGAHMLPGAATSSTVLFEAGAPPVLTEDDILLMYDQDYISAGGRPAATQLVKGMFIELLETQMEAFKFPP